MGPRDGVPAPIPVVVHMLKSKSLWETWLARRDERGEGRPRIVRDTCFRPLPLVSWVPSAAALQPELPDVEWKRRMDFYRDYCSSIGSTWRC